MSTPGTRTFHPGPFIGIAVLLSLIILGLVLLLAERLARHARDISEVGARDAFLVGCGQALALVPGCSRSGTTLTTGMLLGLKREAAAPAPHMSSKALRCTPVPASDHHRISKIARC